MKNSTVRLPAPIRLLVKTFYYMGLASLPGIKRKAKFQKFQYFKYFYFYIVYNFVMAGVVIRFIIYEATYKETFSVLNDIIKTATLTAALLTTVLETLHNSSVMDKFYQIYSRLHYQWSKGRQFQVYGKLFAVLGFYVLVVLLVEVTFVIGVFSKTEWVSNFSYFAVSVTLCRSHLLQMIMYLEIIRLELEQLNREMLQMAQMTQERCTPDVEDLIYKNLTQYMRKYQAIYTMCDLMKRSTSLSFLAIFLQTYIKLLSDCYWAYWVIYNRFDQYEYFEFSLILPTSLIIFLVLVVSKNCMRTAKLIPITLHSIRHRVENIRLSRKIQNFSLQLSYEQISIDVCGCFVINCYMASGILHSISTYMIFYIQFMPKFKRA